MTGTATARPKSADAGWVGEILDCLEQGASVRRDLPGGGRVHIDRPLPFLCLHATGDGDQLAARDVATANASYLIAPEVRAAAPLLDALGRAMLRKFGAFMVIEVAELDEDRLLSPDSPFLPAFETILTLQDRPAVRSAADAFAEAMAKVPVKYRSPRVELKIAAAETAWSTELDPRIARLAIAFAPIYREPKTARLYPDLRRRLVAAIFDALLRACAAFLARSGGVVPAHPSGPGRRVFVEAVERVDRRIDQIARSFDFLLAITPINAEAARQEFRSSRFAAAPRLLYRPLTVEARRREATAVLDPVRQPRGPAALRSLSPEAARARPDAHDDRRAGDRPVSRGFARALRLRGACVARRGEAGPGHRPHAAAGRRHRSAATTCAERRTG